MSVIAPFPRTWDRRPIATFDRQELARILDLYGRMVAAGHWRDYALRIDPEFGWVKYDLLPKLKSSHP